MIKNLSAENLEEFYPFFSQLIFDNFSFYDEKIRRYFLEVVYTQKNLFFWIKNNQKTVITFAKKNQFFGFALIDAPYGGVSFLRFLAVKKEYQNQGIGKKLIAAWKKLAKDQGCHKMELATTPLISGFYQKLGFEKEGLMPLSYFGINQVLMGKVIGKPNIKNIINQ